MTNMLDVWRQLSYVFFVRMASAVRIFCYKEIGFMKRIITINKNNIIASSIKSYGISVETRDYQKIYEDGSNKDSGWFFPVDFINEELLTYENGWGDVFKIKRKIEVATQLDPAQWALDEGRIGVLNNHPIVLTEEYEPKQGDLVSKNLRYLYITTFQGDNYKFYEYVEGFILPAESVKNIDELFSEIEKHIKKASIDIVVEDIKKFKTLLDEGIITQEEFNAKKKELLEL